MSYKLVYASLEQQMLGTDVEEKTFEKQLDVGEYIYERLEPKGCIYVYFRDELSPSQMEASIGFSKWQIEDYSEWRDFNTLYVYEFSSYSDALKFLENYFESSPKMYSN